MDSKKIKVWAHRGASGYAPENTICLLYTSDAADD